MCHAPLFPGIAVCDWSKDKASASSGLMSQALIALTTSEGCTIALFVHCGDELFHHPIWPEAKTRCLLVEEPLVTRETLAPALTYLERSSDLVRARDPVERSELQAYFNELLEEQKSIGLPELIQEFDKVILLNRHIDGHKCLRTGTEGRDPSATLRPLRQFIASRSSCALGELIRGLERKCRDGWTVRRLTYEIFRITQKLLDPSDVSARAEGAPSIQAAQEQDLGVAVWTSMLLGWTDRLAETEVEVSKPRPNLFLVAVDQLGRDFMRRCSPEMAGDPLASLWSDVRKAIPTSLSEPDEPKTPKMRLVSELAAYLDRVGAENSRWITRLRGLLTPSGDMPGQDLLGAVTCPPKSSKHVALADPHAFAQIIGHQTAVASLQNRFSSKAHSTPVILYGPEGVGKRTLARVYARALLCEGELQEGAAPCDRCKACEYFDSGSFGLIEFDAAAVTDSEVREILQNLRFVPFSEHRIIIVANPERAPKVVDTILKTLETELVSTTFIFLVNSLKDLSGTGQSRCAIFRLRPLESRDARRLSEGFLRSAGSVCDDDRVLDLIVAEGRGLPGRLRELCERLGKAQSSSLQETRRALGLDWIENAVSYWRALLGEEDPPISALEVPRLVPSAEATERIRLVLEQLQRFSSTSSSRIEVGAAFMHVDQSLGDLIRLLEKRAAERKVSTEKLVSELAQLWTADEYSDAAGFLGAGVKSREIILGRLVSTA